MDQKKSKLVRVVQHGKGWKEQAQRGGKNYNPRGK